MLERKGGEASRRRHSDRLASFSIMAILLPCSWLSTLFSMVVFPLPRKPVKICKQHAGAQAKTEGTDAEGSAVSQSGPAGVLIAETCENQGCMES